VGTGIVGGHVPLPATSGLTHVKATKNLYEVTKLRFSHFR
jgi:hypothetical protein